MANNDEAEAEWTALEARYATPPVPEPSALRVRRNANRRKARSRLQRRQVDRIVEAQRADAIAAGEPVRVALTQAEQTVLLRRFASPDVPENPLARIQRLQDRGRADRRLQSRAASRRLQLDTAEPVVPPATGPSYDQVGAAVLNLASEQTAVDLEDRGPTSIPELAIAVRSVLPGIPGQNEERGDFPTYAQLTAALRNLTPDVPSQLQPSPGFPSYAQLNAALRNLSPAVQTQEHPAPGHPTYGELAASIRGLPLNPPTEDEDSAGFPTYAQLAAALRALPAEDTQGGLQRAPRVRRNAALGSLAEFRSFPRHQLPPREVRCIHCGSMLWRLELQNACCLNGDVALAPAELPPERIQQLFTNRTFLEKIRGYNSAFAFTSTGAKEDYLINRGNAPYTFRINGSMHHRIGELLPPEGANPAFGQIYMYDGSTEEEVALWGMAFNSGLDLTTLGELQTILYAVNPLAAVYQSARVHANEAQELCLVLLDNPRVDPRRYNRPTANEVAAIMVDGGATASHRDIVLRYRRGGLRRIFETHPLYDPLQYPLLYLRGEVGWSTHARYVDRVTRNNNAKVSLREHTAYRLYMKHEEVEYSLLHRAGRLMQQWCVDQAAKIIEQRLFFQRRLNTQRLYRRELFSGLRDLMLADHVLTRSVPDLLDTGTHIILSSKFPGGVRYMRQQYYDSMAIVRQFGKPDLFITVTTNPNWPEIQENLLPGQTASDRPDIVTRVFKMKLKAILEDITKKRVFGHMQAYVYVVEFQKRGLPHAHILVILKGESKPRSSADYDRFVCAELPDREEHPDLFETVTTCMIHGPCGVGINASCIGEDGKCSKRFPKPFVDETRVDGDGYPVYRRRQPGPVDSAFPRGPRMSTSVRYVSKQIRRPRRNGPKSRREAVVVDNRWVVPYNPYLCQKYNCHINVEICSTVQSVKYLYKYVYKGQDRATVALRAQRQRGGDAGGPGTVPEPVDEVQQYLDARYLSPPEACWTIFKYEMQKKSHHVHRLPVHEEGKQLVHYSTTARLQDVIELNQFTMLTAFFELCGDDSPEGLTARDLLYHEMPLHFVWKKVGSRNRWVARTQGGDKAIGRMISVSPRDANRFYLRLLLCYRRGPTSFESLRTVDGEVFESFKGAALALGLLESDEENHRCLEEAATFQMPGQLRHLFAVLLVYCSPASPEELWATYLPVLSEDHLRDEIEVHNARVRAGHSDAQLIIDQTSVEPDSRVFRRATYLTLQDINSHLISNGQSLMTYVESLPQFEDYSDVETNADIAVRNQNRLIDEETSYDPSDLDRRVGALDTLNNDQRVVYDKVMAAVLPQSNGDSSRQQLPGKLFFLDGPGGTGKSFLLEIILARVRRAGKIALAVAGSGIAAQLLTGERTAHSTFRLPLDPDDTSTCNFGVRSSEAALLKRTSLIVWDEAPMTHRYQYEALDRTLQDLMKKDIPFGGIAVLLSGDFRQTLPVIPRAGPGEVISASLKRSPLWHNFECLRLSINMRVRTAHDPGTAQEMQHFADYLLRIGDGRQETSADLGSDYVKIPSDLLLDTSRAGTLESPSASEKLDMLIDQVYADFHGGNQPDSYFADRIILAPKNSDVLAINDMILDRLPHEAVEYRSVDSLDGDNELERQEHGDLYPPEFLNTISLSGMPPHKLRLKVGTPVMLIRNLNTKEGLCNGTRLRIMELRPNCMKAAIMSGAFAGKKVIIPRVTLISKNSGFPFELRRKQFPVQVAFAMTINKSQGQSIEHLGLYLPEPVFSHGQFYVAVSRVTSRKNIKILVENPEMIGDEMYTKNIVYREIVVQ